MQLQVKLYNHSLIKILKPSCFTRGLFLLDEIECADFRCANVQMMKKI
ncbi:MAG: hypothetical protein JWQ57_509 [Mucilaginibacter sp.]|nr:hypothetical protein [Mucilaginibacter sp.]